MPLHHFAAVGHNRPNLHFSRFISHFSTFPSSSSFLLLLPILLLLPSYPMANARPSSPVVSSKSDEAVEAVLAEIVQGTNNVSSHVLDIALGQPAEGIECTAFKWVHNGGNGGRWTLWGKTTTDARGRIPIVHPDQPLTAGLFKLHFHTKKYFEAQDRQTFYPYIEIVFQIDDPDVHYHVPITLSNFGYSTYKGQ